MASGDTKTEALLNVLGHGGSIEGITGSGNTKTQDYLVDAIGRLQGIEDEVEELKNNPDVVDIVDTYADLQAYDTQHLSDNDIIRVLADETHSGNSTYYKFNKQAETWTFIGEISGGSITPVQTPGNSQTDVMSQNATTSMVYADPSTMQLVQIGKNANAGSYSAVSGRIAIGNGATSTGNLNNIAIGNGASVTSTQYRSICIGASTIHNDTINIGGASYNQDGDRNVLIGVTASVDGHYRENCVCIGYGARASRSGEMNIGTGETNYGYNNTNYRVLGGVHDPVEAHDAATKGYVDANAGGSVHTLSSDDINLDVATSPSGNPAIGLWLLSPGMYYIPRDLGVEVFTCSIFQSTSGPADPLPSNQNYSLMVDDDGGFVYLLLTSAQPFSIEQNGGTSGYINRVDIDPQDSYSGTVITVLPD